MIPIPPKPGAKLTDGAGQEVGVLTGMDTVRTANSLEILVSFSLPLDPNGHVDTDKVAGYIDTSDWDTDLSAEFG